MTSKINIPKISRANTMATSSFRELVGHRVSKRTKFMDKDINISKLSVSEVLEIQDKAKALKDDENGGLELLRTVIRLSAEGASDLTDEDFSTFPMEALASLSNDIMKYSGMSQDQKGN